MRNAVRRMLIALLAMSLVACNNLSEEERRSQDAVSAVGSAVPVSAVARDGPVFFWTGELKGGEAVVMHVPGPSLDGGGDKFFAFWVGNGQVYPVNQASHAFMTEPPAAAAPVMLKEVLDAVWDLPANARVELEKGTQ